MTYEEQLQTDEWKVKRETILHRDRHMCQKCMRSYYLHVHHKIYRRGLLAWEYSDSDLITLCKDCHAREHKIDTSTQSDYRKEEDIYILLGGRIRSSVNSLIGLIRKDQENG